MSKGESKIKVTEENPKSSLNQPMIAKPGKSSLEVETDYQYPPTAQSMLVIITNFFVIVTKIFSINLHKGSNPRLWWFNHPYNPITRGNFRRPGTS